MVTGSANRTCASVVGRTCWVGGGVGGAIATLCGAEDSATGCSATGVGVGLATGAGGGADEPGGPAGRRRGGAFGAAFLPEVAELMSVDMTRCWRQH